MKKVSLVVSVLLLAATISFARARAAERTFSGEIMDSQCASMGNHDAGYKMTGTKTAKDCTVACVKAGGKYVLYEPAKKVTLKIDDQAKAEPFAGEKVKVVGTENTATKTIHIEKIEAVK